MAKNLQEVLDGAGNTVELLRNSRLGAYIYPVVPSEFPNFRREVIAWRETAVLYDQSHHMHNIFISGPDALKLITDAGINATAKFPVDTAKQFVPVSPDGGVFGDGIVFGSSRKSSPSSAARPSLTGWGFGAGALLAVIRRWVSALKVWPPITGRGFSANDIHDLPVPNRPAASRMLLLSLRPTVHRTETPPEQRETMTILSAGPTRSAPGLRLRPWVAGDAADLAAAFRDPVLRRFLLRTSIDSEADARRWIDGRTAEWAAGTRFSFAVLAVPSGNDDVSGPVGYVSVKGISSGKDSAEVGYWTAAGARGRGIASLAVEAVSVWTFASHPIERLELIHALDNPASCRVAHTCGFSFVSALPADPPTFTVPGHLHVRTRP